MEFYLHEGFVSFDGKIVEAWFAHRIGEKRLHVAVIESLEIQKGRKGLLCLCINTIYRAGNMLISFPQEQLPQVERLMDAIKEAKASFQV